MNYKIVDHSDVVGASAVVYDLGFGTSYIRDFAAVRKCFHTIYILLQSSGYADCIGLCNLKPQCFGFVADEMNTFPQEKCALVIKKI